MTSSPTEGELTEEVAKLSVNEAAADENVWAPPLPAPPPPTDLPTRFLRAGKGDPVVGQKRYEATLAWRKEQGIDSILHEASPKYDFIKSHYPHYYHCRGKNNEIVFYELPAKVNLKALREGGVGLPELLRHYTMCSEFQWQYLERDDFAQSIYICDCEGIGMRDFMGETVDFVKKTIGICSEHYPERGGCIFIINVPGWFKMIWSVIKPWIDKDTLKKIYILRGLEEIKKNLQERIPLEHIPAQFGGTSPPFGEAPDQKELNALIKYNNDVANGVKVYDERFTKFVPVRAY